MGVGAVADDQRHPAIRQHHRRDREHDERHHGCDERPHSFHLANLLHPHPTSDKLAGRAPHRVHRIAVVASSPTRIGLNRFPGKATSARCTPTEPVFCPNVHGGPMPPRPGHARAAWRRPPSARTPPPGVRRGAPPPHRLARRPAARGARHRRRVPRRASPTKAGRRRAPRRRVQTRVVGLDRVHGIHARRPPVGSPGNGPGLRRRASRCSPTTAGPSCDFSGCDRSLFPSRTSGSSEGGGLVDQGRGLPQMGERMTPARVLAAAGLALVFLMSASVALAARSGRAGRRQQLLLPHRAAPEPGERRRRHGGRAAAARGSR